MDHAHTSGAVGVAAYDTTLRDGAQQQSVSFTVEDKLAVARLLDALGVAYIEAGWPGAIPKDTEFFSRVRDDLDLRTARLVAFGSTCRPGAAAADDPQVRALIDSGAPVITIVAKSDPVHVERALRTTREENLRMVRETVGVLLAAGREVMVDLEHYFDGLGHDTGYGLQVALTAARAGAGAVIPATPTAAPCPTASAGASASCARLWTRTAGPAAWSGSTPTTTPGWRSPAPWRPSRPAPARCRAASTASASAPATPTS